MENKPILRADTALDAKKAKQEILAANDFTAKYGLFLSEEDAAALVEARKEALVSSGRIEFGGGVLPKLIRAFCDSPFLQQSDYAETLAELQEAFYYFKTDSRDAFTDDELIEFMVNVFNGRAQGSAEYLIGTSLSALCRYARGDFDESDADEIGDLF